LTWLSLFLSDFSQFSLCALFFYLKEEKKYKTGLSLPTFSYSSFWQLSNNNIAWFKEREVGYDKKISVKKERKKRIIFYGLSLSSLFIF